MRASNYRAFRPDPANPPSILRLGTSRRGATCSRRNSPARAGDIGADDSDSNEDIASMADDTDVSARWKDNRLGQYRMLSFNGGIREALTAHGWLYSRLHRTAMPM